MANAAEAVVVEVDTGTSTSKRAAKLAMAVQRLQGRRLRIPVLSELFHHWMSAVMRAEGTLDASSLPQLPPEDSAAELLAKFRPLWADASVHATGDGKATRVHAQVYAHMYAHVHARAHAHVYARLLARKHTRICTRRRT